MGELWTREDYIAMECTTDQIGRPRVPVEENVVHLERITHTREQLVEVAMHSLVQIAQQTRDIPSALKAASAILDRVVGCAVPATRPLTQETPEKPTPDWAPWAGRHGYQNALPEPDPCAPSEPEALDPPHPTSPALAPATESVRRLRVVEAPPPRFWDGPTTPAMD